MFVFVVVYKGYDVLYKWNVKALLFNTLKLKMVWHFLVYV
jgi:hypothetical protein